MKQLSSLKYALLALVIAAVFLPTAKPASASTYRELGDVTAACFIPDSREIAVATQTEIIFLTESGENAKVGSGETATNKPSVSLSGATAIASAGEVLYAVVGDDLYSSTNVSSPIKSGVTLLASYGDALYYYAGNELFSKTNDVETPVLTSAGVTSIAAFSGGVYSLSDGTIYLNGAAAYENVDYSAITFSNALYGLTASGEVVLVETNESVYSAKKIKSISPRGNGLILVTVKNEIYVYSNGETSLVTASASDENGFYSYPLDAEARLGKLYVADYSNDRVSIASTLGDKTTYEYLSVPRPSAVAVATDGAIYVASNSSVIKFAGNEKTVVRTFQSRVTDLFLSFDDVLYAVSGSSLYRADEQTPLATDVDGGAYSENGIITFGGQTVKRGNSTLATLPENVIAIAADVSGNAYALTSDGSTCKLYRVTSSGYELKRDDLPLGSSSVFVSRSSSPVGSFGDVVIADKSANDVIVLPAASVGVSPVATAPLPSEYDDDNSIFRFASAPTALLGSTDEADVRMTIPEGKRIIVLKYAFGYGLSHCAVESNSGELAYGYVFRSTLSDPLAYRTPISEYCTVYGGSVKLYSLPSKGSAVVLALEKNARLQMLDFPDCEWYKVKAESGATGYIPSATASVNAFVPDGERPQINGEIIAANGSSSAQAYLLEDGVYSPIIGVILPEGTKIEVAESFDSSQKYTAIRYYDDRLGTLSCYVLTDHVRFNGTSTVQVVAIVVAVATAVLLVALLIGLYSRRRKL